MPGSGGVLRPLLDGLVLRCPACRRGRLFRSLFSWRAVCPACGRDFDRGGEFTGAMMLAQFLWGGIALYGYLALLFFTEATLEVQVAWVVGFGAVMPFLTYRNVKGVWAGIRVAHEHLEPPGPQPPPG